MSWGARGGASRLPAALLAFLLASCGGRDGGPLSLTLVDPPAAPLSSAPHLTLGADGKVYLSWTEQVGETEHRLRFSRWDGAGWSEARTVAGGSDWFVNWADFPSMAALEDGTLAAHWLARSGSGPYAYDVLLSVSRDGGLRWSEPVRPHGDGTESEHGFASLVPAGQSFEVVWLDGRGTVAEPPRPMTLRHAALGRDGVAAADTLIDESVCDCCQTDAVRLADGSLLVAYRDRSPGEVRDIATARLEDGRWREQGRVHEDGWRIDGCPVNGPALAARGQTVACAWFTRPGSEGGEVRLAFSRDSGRNFADPIRVDGGDPAGRVDLVMLDDGSALVSWLELGEPPAIRIRRVPPTGPPDEPRTISETAATRSSGFPRMARLGQEVLVAWTDTDHPSRVRTALLSPGR